MPQITFAPQAVHDLNRLRIFLNGKSPSIAQRALQKLLTSLKHLETHPELGRQVEDRSEEYRELIIPFGRNGYIAAYRYTEVELIVLGIWHQREDRSSAEIE